MDPATIIFAALFPLAIMAIPVSAIWTHHRRKVLEMRLQAQGEAGRSNAQYEDLEERMRILERIVTDKGYDVAHQIEALRDSGRDKPARLPQREPDRQS